MSSSYKLNVKYYIIAGEASGDLHGSNLIKALMNIDVNAEIRAWGGDLMAQQGAEVVKHYRDLAFMGFLEVLLNIRTIARNLSFCKRDIEAFKPDCIVFIDYPGFNLRIAKWAKSKGKIARSTSVLIRAKMMPPKTSNRRERNLNPKTPSKAAVVIQKTQ